MDKFYSFLNHIFHLSFSSKKLEKNYQEWFFETSKKQNILVIKIAIFIYLLYGPFNYFMTGTNPWLFTVVTLFVVAFSLLFYQIKIQNISRSLHLWIDYFMLIIISSGPFLILLNVDQHPEFFYTDILFPVFLIFTLFSIGFSLALMAVLTLDLIFFYYLFSQDFPNIDTPLLVYALIIATGVSALAGYFIEKSKRTIYLEKVKNEEFHQILKNSHEGITILDKKTLRYLYANDMILKIHGLTLQEIQQRTLSDINPAFTASLIEKLKETFEKEGKVIHTIELSNAQGKKYDVQIIIQEGSYEGEDVYVITSADITTQKNIQRQFEKLASYDTLTELLNRRKFNVFAEHEYDLYQRYKNPSSLIICDIDLFKKINDEFGHLKGDEVLKKISAIIRSSVRKSDIVARWGGEEFAILLPNTSGEDAYEAALKINQNVAASPCDLNKKLTISCGISELRENDTLEGWFKRVDDLLYKAKKNGRNQVQTA